MYGKTLSYCTMALAWMINSLPGLLILGTAEYLASMVARAAAALAVGLREREREREGAGEDAEYEVGVKEDGDLWTQCCIPTRSWTTAGR